MDTNRQTDKPNLYIDRNCITKVCGFLDCDFELQTSNSTKGFAYIFPGNYSIQELLCSSASRLFQETIISRNCSALQHPVFYRNLLYPGTALICSIPSFPGIYLSIYLSISVYLSIYLSIKIKYTYCTSYFFHTMIMFLTELRGVSLY